MYSCVQTSSKPSITLQSTVVEGDSVQSTNTLKLKLACVRVGCATLAAMSQHNKPILPQPLPVGAVVQSPRAVRARGGGFVVRRRCGVSCCHWGRCDLGLGGHVVVRCRRPGRGCSCVRRATWWWALLSWCGSRRS